MDKVQFPTRDVPITQVSAFQGAHSNVSRILSEVLGVSAPDKQSISSVNPVAPLFWIGPGRWWLVSDKPSCREIAASMSPSEVGVVDLSAGRRVIRLIHLRSRDILAKGCGLDFDDAVFPAGAYAATKLARLNVLLHALSDEKGFDIYVPRSYTNEMLRWLSDASVEFSM